MPNSEGLPPRDMSFSSEEPSEGGDLVRRSSEGSQRSRTTAAKATSRTTGLPRLSHASSMSSLTRSARGPSSPTLHMDLRAISLNREWLSVSDKGVLSARLSSKAESVSFERDTGASVPCLSARLATNVTRTADYFALYLPLEPICEEDEFEDSNQ
ncbi:hypothetical protein FVE85_2928 [Porphyridium purpureum]|uniref:Uncharacterized protein n=1 Tax=Porphyridium purpureum TaxID=35688 RepID=A0A5J4YW82_PORPP|nr:hypothetical protein FVE85_2928 [Porphyridium purpureum]|eukprot:POR2203..scf227_4